ncbi:glycoside hydrolase family 16 protein [Hysterangium stoloniferum]|nr:glycoside hydrolase family 16 protein [Hysterangium stoloniferum]
MFSSRLNDLCLGLVVFSSVVQGQYQLSKTYAGNTFFDDWVFYNNFDNLTNGDAIFVSQAVATQSKLAFVNSAGNAIIKVDNSTVVPFNEKRNTVRITSSDAYSVGSVWIADMLHVPFGCSVWPAWWSQAPDWPKGGEIDTFEGVNLVTENQIALHTEPGCDLNQATASLTGTVQSTDCSFSTNSNQGCVVADPRPQSYGAAFAQAGGGVFVTEFAENGISVWFFPRANVPDSITNAGSGNFNTSTLGTPVANYPAKGCTTDTFFEPQHLIFDITLCGDFAGNPSIFAQTCSGTCYNDYVIGPPSTYDNAFFEIKSVKVFKDPSVKGNGATRLDMNINVLAMVGAILVGSMLL